MTREELREHCERQIQQFERVEKIMPVTPNDWKRYEEHKLILELLEQEPILDKIRAEIKSYGGFELGEGFRDGYNTAMVRVLNILDKYRAESEV
jgi:hypothetical protein